MPGRAALQTTDIERAIAGDLVAGHAAIGGQYQSQLGRQRGVERERQGIAGRPGIARHIQLAQQDGLEAVTVAGAIDSTLELDAVAAAIGPGRTVVGAVFPDRPGFQSAHIDRTVIGDLVAGGCPVVLGQGRIDLGWQRGIEGEAERRTGSAGIASHINLAHLHLLGTIRVAGAIGCTLELDAVSTAIGPGGAVIGAVLPACSAFQPSHVDGAILCDAIGRRGAAIGRQGNHRLGGCACIEREAEAVAGSALVAGRIGLPHLNSLVAVAGQLEAAAATGDPAGPAVGAVFPCRTGFQAIHLDGTVIGNPVAGRTAVVGQQGQARLDRRGGIQGEAQRIAVGTGIASGIGLANHDVAQAIGVGAAIDRALEFETAAGAIAPGTAAIEAVLPVGPGHQLADLDGAVIGQLVGGRAATVSGQGNGGLLRRAAIEREAEDIADRPHIAGHVDLPGHHVLVAVTAQQEAGTAAARPVDAVVHAVLPGRPRLQSGDVDCAIAGDHVVDDAGIPGQRQRQLDGDGAVQREAEAVAHRTGIACDIGLAYQHRFEAIDVAIAIGRAGHTHTGAAAIAPAAPGIEAVLPGGPGLQSSDVDSTVIGHAIGG